MTVCAPVNLINTARRGSLEMLAAGCPAQAQVDRSWFFRMRVRQFDLIGQAEAGCLLALASLGC
jgi:hypothetical protein